jgi:hypothetical protein
MYLSISRICLLVAFVTSTGIASFSQDAEVDSLQKKFNTYRIQTNSEKIYVHTDQELYLTGETLWFKLYIVDASLHRPADLSKVAYLELLNKSNQPVLQTKVELRDGFGNGSIFLPASLVAGNYTFRAYTNWMKNFGADFYFQKRITVINPFRKLELEKSVKVIPPDVQFFPEGGSLVVGLKSKVAFRAISTSGKGIRFNGVVLNNNNDTVTTFHPHKFGMGSFHLTPVAGDSYRAVIKDEEGRLNTYKLPEIHESGYVIQVKDSTDNLIVVSIGSTTPLTPGKGVYLFMHTRNIVSTASKYYLSRGNTIVTIPKNKIQEGVSHITLFDDDLNPVCERLYFLPVKTKLLVDIQTNQREFGVRRKIGIDITTKNIVNAPEVANLSVAVYKADSLQQKTESNILSYLLLDSDLSGSIESPEYYTNSDSPEVIQSIDNVMLTHGWRRFQWKDIFSKVKPTLTYLPEYRGHVIRGKVTGPTGSPVSGITTYLASPSRNVQIYGSTSNTQGGVQFEMKDFAGSRKIVLQTNLVRDSTSRIQILNPFSESPPTLGLPPFQLSAERENELTSRSIGMQVQDIFFQEKNSQVRSIAVDTTSFYGKADATYYLDDYTRFPVMEEVMREYVPGVMVRKRKDGFHFLTLDAVNKKLFDEDPMVLLDGIPLFDIDEIMEFDPLKIKKMEVLTRKMYHGVIAMPGIVSYTTYSGDLSDFTLDPKCVVLDYEGLQLQREFYTPKYETAKQRDTRLPDQRNLLHWAPTVITGKDGKQRVEFYSSDLTGTFLVVIEGLTKNGLAGSGSSTFQVMPYEN